MPEIYPKRASGEFAGTKCRHEKCRFYARFTVVPFETAERKTGTCAQHLPMVVKGLMLTSGRSVVIQEVPGNWSRGGAEAAVVNGKTVRAREWAPEEK